MLQLQQGLTRAHGCKEQRSGVTTQNRRAPPARATNPRTGGRLTQRPAGTNPRTGQAAVIFLTLSARTCSSWTLAVTCPRSCMAVVQSLHPTMTWPRSVVTVVLVWGLLLADGFVFVLRSCRFEALRRLRFCLRQLPLWSPSSVFPYIFSY